MSINIQNINGYPDFYDHKSVEDACKSASIARFCEYASFYSFNKFPLTSAEAPIDLLLIIVIKKENGNYISFRSEKGEVTYLHNIIIPIRYVDIYKSQNFSFVNEQCLLIENNEIDCSYELTSMKYGLNHFLSTDCLFDKKNLFINPLIFFKSDNYELVSKAIIVNKNLNWQNIFEFIKRQIRGTNTICSYNNWLTPEQYEIELHQDIKRCVEKASSINFDNGYLTKMKLDRISKHLNKGLKVYEQIGKNLVVINGKAGTGKTNLLLSNYLYTLSQGRNAKYLTYNNLLVFDIAQLVKQHLNSSTNANHGAPSVLTLHKFFYRLSKQLGILTIMSLTQAEGLTKTLEERISRVKQVLIDVDIDLSIFKNSIRTDVNQIKENISNANLPIAIKEFTINFINYSRWNHFNEVESFSEFQDSYRKHNINQIYTKLSKEVFNTYYYGVLENIWKIINNTLEYYNANDIGNKTKHLEVIFNLKENLDFLSENDFIQTVRRKIGGFRHGFYLFIDEAQDCHYLERDILIKIFGVNKTIVASGGKEQLIRHVEVCNWERSNNQSTLPFKQSTGRTSFRMKTAILELCNFFANKYSIDLNLEPIKSDDKGKVIVDFRPTTDKNYYKEIINEMLLRGEVHGCTPYESLLFLVDTSSLKYSETEEVDTYINEYDNLEEHVNRANERWQGIEEIEVKYPVWDGTVNEKWTNDIPYSGEIRVIHYESCRGLEAWCVANIDVDNFFERKFADVDAEKFLIEEIMPLEDRKRRYAATWLLMALTRAIDTLYLKVSSKQSELGKLLYQYAKDNKCTIYE